MNKARQNRIFQRSFVIVLVSLSLVLLVAMPQAGAGRGDTRRRRPIIDEVSVIFGEMDLISVRGRNLDSGRNPVVTLGTDRMPLRVLGSPTDEEILLECPLVGPTPTCTEGDYQLRVSIGPAPRQLATYALTIGAVGPAPTDSRAFRVNRARLGRRDRGDLRVLVDRKAPRETPRPTRAHG